MSYYLFSCRTLEYDPASFVITRYTQNFSLSLPINSQFTSLESDIALYVMQKEGHCAQLWVLVYLALALSSW